MSEGSTLISPNNDAMNDNKTTLLNVPARKRLNLLLSTDADSSEFNFISKTRARYLKNNKFVFVHSSKTQSTKSVDVDNFIEEIRENEVNFSSKSRGSKFRGVSKNGNQWQVLVFLS